ncbi:glutathione hydrolase 1 proenzyme-like [Hydractinia symbiolongicarpus]|uniref:glutathione hydrolase 1 proenzyme-like n=1 Tax=Hydractinia symbiolongicarpus TaxID=13093 RepID=UPI00254A08F8|nr:glutathione hydrolase 1 proenzyme-like [Hydractinia symbiolongicarpus]
MGKEAKYTVLTRRPSKKKCLIISLIGLILLIVIIVIIVVATKKKDKDNDVSPSSGFVAQKYKKAAVAADAKICSQVGANMLKKNGSATDAAVATLFCLGVVNLQSCGIGGGGFMVFYQKALKKFTIFDYREVAPLAATKDMFINDSSVRGGLAIGVPGQVKGLLEVHKKHGKLNWSELVEPAIKLADEGIIISKALAGTIKSASKNEHLSDNLKKLLTKKDDVTFLGEGDVLVNKRLASTLRTIQMKPNDFYVGDLAKKIVADVTEAKGLITEEDLKKYSVVIREVVKFPLPNDLVLNTMSAPGGGPIVSMILNIMSGYNLSNYDLSKQKDQLAYYHKLVESMKFAYAQRGLLGDPDFVPEKNISEVLDLVKDPKIGAKIREKIWMNQTHPLSYYGGYFGKNDFGTSHVSILAENGDAVAATATINWGFGSYVRSLDTGIIYNNEMDDFSTPGKSNLYGYPPSPANFIEPRKRPLSSMSPSIVTDKNGDVKMIAGASGGSRIISGTAQVLLKKLYLGLPLGECVSSYRLHHQGVPNYITYNPKYAPPMRLLDDLKKLRHTYQKKGSISVVQAVYKEGNDIYAMSDPRKGGESDGI